MALDWAFPKSLEDQVTANDGRSILLPNENEITIPIAILLHGVTGGSGESYITEAVEIYLRKGWIIVAYNQRGCGSSTLTSPKTYCAAGSWDCKSVMEYIHGRFPQAPLIAIGFSMGGNILAKYLGEAGASTPLLGGISLGNPLQCIITGKLLCEGLTGLIYGRDVLLRLQNYIRRHRHFVAAMGFDPDHIIRSRSVREFDDRFTSQAFGFGNAENFYYRASSFNTLEDVAVPLLCLNAHDDPIAPSTHLPDQPPPHVVIAITKTGGHLGWLEGWWPFRGPNWADRACIEFLEALLRSTHRT